jgi:L-arabinose isomerase
MKLEKLQLWFITGSQHLYGPETLKQVAADSLQIARGLSSAACMPVKIVYKPVVTRPEEISNLCQQANASSNCIGVVAWMHTFSPAKMWIHGLKILRKPLAHLHTQFNRDIPWSTIDMDFMNLNQAAHGDREAGFMMTRLRLNRKVIVGHWEDEQVREDLALWARAAAAWHDWQGAKFARFGDNMREVAVTEGDKVAAQMRFGFSVNGYSVGDLVRYVNQTSETDAKRLVREYEEQYQLAKELTANGKKRKSLLESAKIELGLRAFLQAGNFKGFTTTFEDLHGLTQLPGLAVQRLMADGYGFAAEGDWKTAALVRAMKVMAAGLSGGTSFMEDYTYHMPDSANSIEGGSARALQVLGAHMLEVCPTIASAKPSLEVHPLGIGGKADPVRLVFDTPPGPALNTCLLDMGNRFRLVTNEVEVITPEQPLPNLPVARAVWIPLPDLKTAAACWIHAGGAHHTGFSQAVRTQTMDDFAQIAGVEHVIIDNQTSVRPFTQELRWNEVYYALSQGWTV